MRKSLSCILGFHDWSGCTCIVCNKHRNEQHDLDGCKCRKCGMTVHDWTFDYFCGTANVHSDSSHGCNTCGAAWPCGGEIVTATCTKCGATEIT